MVLFQKAKRIVRNENNQSPSGNEYKTQLGKCSDKGRVANLISDKVPERLTLSNQVNIFNVSCLKKMYKRQPVNKGAKCPTIICFLTLFIYIYPAFFSCPQISETLAYPLVLNLSSLAEFNHKILNHKKRPSTT